MVQEASTCSAETGTSGEEKILLLDGPGGRLRVSDGGRSGIPVVFLHGLGGELEVWRGQLEHLRPERRAIAYDQRGHGESDPSRDGTYDIASLSQDLHFVTTTLMLERFFLVGHSLSGVVLTLFASIHPEKIAGLVYADACGDLGFVPRHIRDEIVEQEASPGFGRLEQRQAFSRMLGPAARPTTRERLLASLARIDLPAYAAMRRGLFEFDARPLLPRYTGPRLCIEAPEGEHSAGLFAALDPSAPKKTIPGVSHWLMMDDPEAFDRALDPFIGFSP